MKEKEKESEEGGGVFLLFFFLSPFFQAEHNYVRNHLTPSVRDMSSEAEVALLRSFGDVRKFKKKFIPQLALSKRTTPLRHLVIGP